MKNLLNPDGPVMVLITKIAQTAWLNILWFVFSLPVITLGASTTALYTVTLKMVSDDEGGITHSFIDAFRSNLKSSTKVWGILMIFGFVLAVDGYVLSRLRYENAFWTLITALVIVAAAAYCFILLYVFPLMARFENTTLAMLKNSLFIAIRYLICTACLAAIHFGMVLVVVRFFTPAIIFGEGLVAYLCSCLLKGVLTQLEPPEETSEEEMS